MERLLRALQKRGFRHGLRGGHPLWLVVGASAWMLIRARRQDDVVYRTVLLPGEQLTVTTRRRGGD